MAEVTQEQKKKPRSRELHPFLIPEERLVAWRNIRGIWKGRKPSPVKEMRKIRLEWDREFPPFRS